MDQILPEDVEASVLRAMAELDTAMEDAQGDYPDVNPDDVYSEMVNAIAAQLSSPAAAEFKRRTRGW